VSVEGRLCGGHALQIFGGSEGNRTPVLHTYLNIPTVFAVGIVVVKLLALNVC